MIETNLGLALRSLREKRGLSLRTLAENAGFSAPFLSQVENGQAVPSIASMEKIAQCLGVTLGEFFSQAQERHSPIVRAGERNGIDSEWSKARIEGLAPSHSGQRLEALVITLEPGGRSGKHPQPHPKEQVAFVLSGEVNLTLDAESFDLKTGDAASLAAGSLRRWENQSTKNTQVLIVSAIV